MRKLVVGVTGDRECNHICEECNGVTCDSSPLIDDEMLKVAHENVHFRGFCLIQV